MSCARPIHPGKTYLITRRTERRHCLLRPDTELNALVSYALIVSARKHGILLHAFCAMSTHLHYVVTDPLSRLPEFLKMFHQLLAIGIKIIRKWDGAVWDRCQTSVVDLCTRQAIVEKIAYTLANPVESGLVWEAHEWPGIKTRVHDIGEQVMEAKRPDRCFSTKNPQWVLDAKLEVSLPPSIPLTDADTFRDDITKELARLEAAAHRIIPKHRVLGAARVLKVSPESRITGPQPSRGRNPTFAVGRGNREALAQAKRELRNFRAAYRRALMKWRAGDRDTLFPAGTYAMRIFHNAHVSTSDTKFPITG